MGYVVRTVHFLATRQGGDCRYWSGVSGYDVRQIGNITANELAARWPAGAFRDATVQFVDCRERIELELTHLDGFFNLPIGEYPSWAPQLRSLVPGKETIVMCHTGCRSAKFSAFLLAVVSPGRAPYSVVSTPSRRRSTTACRRYLMNVPCSCRFTFENSCTFPKYKRKSKFPKNNIQFAKSTQRMCATSNFLLVYLQSSCAFYVYRFNFICYTQC